MDSVIRNFAQTPVRLRRSRRNRIVRVALLALSVLGIARSAFATDGPVFLFGGVDLDDFLGCVNCDRSEPFSVWNESVAFGDPANPDSIWNREGRYGSPTSDTSPWNPDASHPPVAVDRVGNRYGYFTRNPAHPDRVRRNPDHEKWKDFDLLAWLLENYDWAIAHLDYLRDRY